MTATTKNVNTNAANTIAERLKQAKLAAPTANDITENTPIVFADVQESLAPDVKWQQYRSARASVRTITESGKRISFTGGEYFTREADVAAWLDLQIANRGLPGITKGELMSTSDRDPTEKLRKKHIAEYMATEEAKVLAASRGQYPDMGKTEKGANINPANSKAVASGASA